MDAPENIKNSLTGIKKDTPFSVPESYFTDFQSRLNEKIANQNKPAVKSRILLTWKTYAAAAVLIIMAVLAGRTIFNNKYRQSENLHAQISVMVEDELYSINEQTILEIMEPETTGQSVAPSVEPEEAIDYLLNEDMNESDLLNEL